MVTVSNTSSSAVCRGPAALFSNVNVWRFTSFILFLVIVSLKTHPPVQQTTVTTNMENVEYKVPRDCPYCPPQQPIAALTSNSRGREDEFYAIARATGTDKVTGVDDLANCLAGKKECNYSDHVLHFW